MALIATIQGGFSISDPGPDTVLANIIGAMTILCGISLAIGFLTPLAGTVIGGVVTATGAHWLPCPSGGPLESRLPMLLTLIMAVSVLILGPGAYSVDARLFGRREIIIPRQPPMR